MGKLKGLGKKKNAETPMSTVVESQEAPREDTVRDPDQRHELELWLTKRSHRVLSYPSTMRPRCGSSI